MSILLAVIGVIVGAIIGGHLQWRSDVAKERQQLESKTPYDYALTNARADNKRYRKELVTIQATKQIEADTERIRNEIGTILSEVGKEASEEVYEPNKMRLEIEAAGKRWESNLRALYGDWEIPDVDKAFMDSTDLTFRQYYDVIKTTDDKRHPAGRAALERERQDEVAETSAPAPWGSQIPMEEWAGNYSKAFARGYGTDVSEVEHVVKSGETLSQIARKYGVKVWDIVEDNELLVYDNLDEIGVVRVRQRLKIRDNVREDDVEDEQSSEDAEERSLINDIKDKVSENVELAVEFAKRTVQDDEAIRKQLEETSKELAEEIGELRRRMREFREEEKYYGETLYRKGNR